MDETSGAFLVTHAEPDSAVLRDVARGQVHTLSSNPGVDEGDVLSATVAPEPPLSVTWSVVAVESRCTIAVELVDEPPTERARALAGDEGDLVTAARDDGELHVLAVRPGLTADAADDLLRDEATLVRAARLGASRVEVRAGDGVVTVRYLS